MDDHEMRSRLTIGAIALVASVVWLAIVAWFFWGAVSEDAAPWRANALRSLIVTLGIAVPVALIWMAAATLQSARTLKRETEQLHLAVEAIRFTTQEKLKGMAAEVRQELEAEIGEISRNQAKMAAEITALSAPKAPGPVLAAPNRPTPSAPQKVLELDTEESAIPQALAPEDFIRAMNFPENEQDKEGFRVLRAALDHHPTAELVKAAQDVLTLLSQDGIYMDDLSPHRPPAALWRAFADGARGDAIAGLAGIRDRSSLALTSGRIKEDTVFRDAAHQFLRLFDRVFASFVETASDDEIARFGDTRTARAFMLVGRVAGSFG